MGTLRRRRVWLAVLLAILVSGLGHAYLRRWGRAFGWYLGITATLVFVVPDAAIDQLLGAGRPSFVDVAPVLLVVLASIVDAYVLAIRNNREYDRQQRERTEAGDPLDATGIDAGSPSNGSFSGGPSDEGSVSGGPSGDDASGREAGDPAEVTCPHCGRETDAELDFCHWCTEPLTDGHDSA